MKTILLLIGSFISLIIGIGLLKYYYPLEEELPTLLNPTQQLESNLSKIQQQGQQSFDHSHYSEALNQWEEGLQLTYQHPYFMTEQALLSTKLGC